MSTTTIQQMSEVLKVSAKSDPKKVAGAIAELVRQNKDVVVTGIGAGAVNQAVKSVAIANGYLGASGMMLAMLPSFFEAAIENQEKTGIKIQLFSSGILSRKNGVQGLKVSGKTKPGPLAGAITGAVREDGPPVLSAIGAGAVNQALKGIAVANRFLAPTGSKIVAIPGFTDVILDKEEITALKFYTCLI